MGGRRTRHSAKTSDRALKKQAAQQEQEQQHVKHTGGNDDDDDDMYDEVDRFHNKKEEDWIRLDKNDASDDNDDDGLGGVEGVMDLGLAPDENEDSSSGSGSSSSEEEDDASASSDGSAAVSSSDDDDDSDEESSSSSRLLEWGRRKRDYYHGDTADLEIGQEFADAELEEEAGREVQRERSKHMREDDFSPFFQTMTPTEEKEEEKEEGATVTTDTGSLHDRRSKLRQLSPSVRKQYLDAAHPEFFPIVSYFGGNDFVKGLRDTVLPVAKELLDQKNKNRPKDIGTTPSGYTYLKHKRLLQMSAALNLCMYLLLKDEEVATADKTASVNVRHHPVLARLNALAKLANKTQRRVEKPLKLQEQLNKLVQALEYIKKSPNNKDEDNVMSNTDDESSNSSEEEEEDVVANADTSNTIDSASEQNSVSVQDEESIASSSNGSQEDNHKDDLVTEARFGVRAQDVSSSELPPPRRRTMMDYGDDDDDADMDADRQIAVRHLSATTNTLWQKERRKEHKKKFAHRSDTVDDFHQSNVGGTTYQENNDDVDTAKLERGLASMEEHLGGDEDGDDYYSNVARATASRKQTRRDFYAVAPKYPRLDAPVDGERAISNQMLRNRGLVPHKNKLNRNPRAKKREQYRKALIRRRGAVRDVRSHEENYGGEQTGIKSHLSRSRKLGVKR